MSAGWAGGSSRRWREVTRPAVLARDKGRCMLRLPGTWRTRGQGEVQCRGVATEVHHIHGKGRCAGCRADQLDHLQSACKPCNLKVGDPGRATTNPRPKPMTRW